MSQDYSPLALDDLVHIMSPSPAPQTLHDDSDVSPRTRSASPEPLPESDIVQIRRKVVEMRNTDQPDAQLTPREKELVEMVLRLTAAIRPDSEQLLRQADMISALIQQRDLLLYQAEEQHLRWSSEKDGWARMAEALLAQQSKNRLNPEQDEDSERIHAAETDNKNLRQRLNETQSRQQLLESELTKLRPLLLMQPLMSRSPIPPPTPNPKTQYTRRRKKDANATENEEHGPSDGDAPTDPLDTPSHASRSQVTPRAKSRKLDAPANVHPPTTTNKRRPSQKTTSRGLSADARAEHLLLAARRIGKQRAGIVSGMAQHLEDLERERRREDSAATAVATTPKTPKRTMSHAVYPPEGGYVYVNGQMRPGPGMPSVPLFIPAYPHHILQTPTSSTTAPSVPSSAPQSAQKSKQDTRTTNPQTPLDSLLNAARSMMRKGGDGDGDEDEDVDVVGDSPGPAAGSRHARSRDMLGSPVPKRRNLGARADKLSADSAPALSVNAGEATNTGAGRVRSALDVLADQAAAFSTQESQTQPETQTKGKGKMKADPQSQEPSSSMPKPRGRTKSRRKEPDADTTSSATPTSRSRTPRSDAGDNPSGATHTGAAEPRGGGSASEAPVDPGGGTGSTTTSNSSSQTLDSTSVSEANQVATSHGAQSPRRISDTTDDLGEATPRQGPRVQNVSSGEGLGAEPSPAPARVPIHVLTDNGTSSTPMLENECREASPLPQRSETVPSGATSDRVSSTVVTAVRNRKLVRVAEQDASAPAPATKRQRSPYVKWSKEEDDLLAQAVAKYGQKWDLVQKALPSRGYHQVRQRWLRKLGVFDSKPDLSSFQTAVTTFPSTPRADGVELRGNPKLGLAPLSSERAFSGLVGRPPSLPS